MNKSNIISIDLFGSYARDEQDEYSDYDVLVVLKNNLKEATYQLDSYDNLFEKVPSYSFYSENKLKNMFMTGHLFAWHLFLESKNLYSFLHANFIRSLGQPNKYKFDVSNSIGFLKILDSAIKEIENRSSNIYFELGVAFIALRNLGLEIGYYKNKIFDFSPYSPISVSPSFPLSIEQLNLLRLARYVSTRGLDVDLNIPDNIAIILKRSLDWFSSQVN